MSIFDLIDPDQFKGLKRTSRPSGRTVSTASCAPVPDDLRGNQQFIAGLDWVLELITPKPERREKGRSMTTAEQTEDHDTVRAHRPRALVHRIGPTGARADHRVDPRQPSTPPCRRAW